MRFKTTESVELPTFNRNYRKNFDLQVHREFENILCIYEGFGDDTMLKAKSIPGYGFHVFLDMSHEALARARQRKGQLRAG